MDHRALQAANAQLWARPCVGILPTTAVQRLKISRVQRSSENASPKIGIARCSANLSSSHNGTGDQHSLSITRRRALMASTLLLPLLPSLRAQPARAEEEEEAASRMDGICTEIKKAVTKSKAAGVLRLAFHDAGTFNMNTRKGGMNGSIVYELERPESSGLKRPMRVLEKVKLALEPVMAVSWADLIAVAGAESVAICGGPKITVSLGRIDSLAADPEGEMPEETLGATELKKKFQVKGFSTQELVALSGAHTIGTKGFGAPDVFDNTYYKILLEKPWKDAFIDLKGNSMTTMVGLQSDRNLADDKECLKWLHVYADSQEQFFQDFSSAYVKLVNTGARWA